MNWEQFRRTDGSIDLFEAWVATFTKAPWDRETAKKVEVAREHFERMETVQPTYSRQVAGVALAAFELTVSLTSRR